MALPPREFVVKVKRPKVYSGSWSRTGNKIDNNLDAKGRGSDLSNATQTNPIRTRDRLGASLLSNANVVIFDKSKKIAAENEAVLMLFISFLPL